MITESWFKLRDLEINKKYMYLYSTILRIVPFDNFQSKYI